MTPGTRHRVAVDTLLACYDEFFGTDICGHDNELRDNDPAMLAFMEMGRLRVQASIAGIREVEFVHALDDLAGLLEERAEVYDAEATALRRAAI